MATEPKAKASKVAMLQRMRQVEDQLIAGTPSGRIQEMFAEKWGVGERAVREVIQRVNDRMVEDGKAAAPYRRELRIRMLEGVARRAIATNKLGAAVGALNVLAKLEGSFAQQSPEAQARLEALGPPPTDPTQGVIYAQNVVLVQMTNIIHDPRMDPVLKSRLLSDLTAKVGLVHTKVAVADKVEQVTKKLAAAKDRSGGMDRAHGIDLPATARGGRRRIGQQEPDRLAADSPSPEDGGDAPRGGRSVGPSGPKVH